MATSYDAWARLRELGGDIERYAAAVRECGEVGHVYRLHATKATPMRVTCKQCPAEWQIEAAGPC